MFTKNQFKKAMAPVVVVVLIAVVATVSTIGLQTWYTSYQDGVFAEVEDTNLERLNVDHFDSTGIFVRNTNEEDVNFTDIKIGSTSCVVNGTIPGGETAILDLGNCNSSIDLGAQDLVVVTDVGLLTKKVFIRSVEFTPSNGSGSGSGSYTGSFTGDAYNSHLGFISFSGTGYSVTVTDNLLDGHAYSEHYGYISFNGTGYGVNITDDVLHGYAYGEHVGYINFNNSPTYQVTINGTNLGGFAYSEHFGYIHFNYSTYYDVAFS